MTSNLEERIADFHVRLGRVEAALAGDPVKKDSPFEDGVELVSAVAAFVLCFVGFGAPNHYYQYVFAILVAGVLYHREIFPRPTHWYEWIGVAVNTLVIAMLLKIVIGGGEPRPFHWISYPVFEGGLTSFKLTWQHASIAEWQLQLTVIQTFFLVLTMFGMLIGFDLFCALASFVLVLLALPALATFDWSWALPGMIAALFSFYLQADESTAPSR